MWLYQVSVVLLMLSYSVFGSECIPNEWEKQFKAYNVKLNWHAALLNCSRQRMALATVESQEEWNMLIKAIEDSDGDSTRWWIGGSDLHKTGDYIWFSTDEPITYNKFPKSQPDNYKQNGETEHCVEVVHYGNYYWNDYFCTINRTFICEYYVCNIALNEIL